jgi:intracellular sulfur oxidation DsrE/DsrF family protein
LERPYPGVPERDARLSAVFHADRERRLRKLVEDLDRILHAEAEAEIVVVAARGAIALWRIEEAEE